MTTEERLAKLEKDLSTANRRNRWLMAIVGIVALGVGLSWVMAVTSGPALASKTNDESQVIRAAGFVLVDDQGRERGVFSMSGANPMLALFDEHRGNGVLLISSAMDTGLSLADGNDNVRARLTLTDEGPSLSMGEINSGRVHLTAREDGSGLTLSAGNGDATTFLFAQMSSHGLQIQDKTGKPRIIMAQESGNPSLSFRDENDGTRLWLSIADNGPFLSLADRNDTIRAMLGASASKSPDGRVILYPESTLWLKEENGEIWLAPH